MKADLNRHTIYNVGFYASITTFERIIFQGYSYIKLQQSPFYCLYLLLQPKNGLYHGETHLFVFKLSLSSFAFVLKENQVTSTYSRKQCQTSVLGHLLHREKKSFLRSKHGLYHIETLSSHPCSTSFNISTSKYTESMHNSKA